MNEQTNQNGSTVLPKGVVRRKKITVVEKPTSR